LAATLFQILFFSWVSRTIGKKIRIRVVQPNRTDLELVTEVRAAGKIVSGIVRRYPLSEVPAALRYLADGSAKGKVVITVDHLA
jgi:D-arabinose 1-dehydrogenase-like Zn-dependent alcohol dehydrogenase